MNKEKRKENVGYELKSEFAQCCILALFYFTRIDFRVIILLVDHALKYGKNEKSTYSI